MKRAQLLTATPYVELRSCRTLRSQASLTRTEAKHGGKAGHQVVREPPRICEGDGSPRCLWLRQAGVVTEVIQRCRYVSKVRSRERRHLALAQQFQYQKPLPHFRKVLCCVVCDWPTSRKDSSQATQCSRMLGIETDQRMAPELCTAWRSFRPSLSEGELSSTARIAGPMFGMSKRGSL